MEYIFLHDIEQIPCPMPFSLEIGYIHWHKYFIYVFDVLKDLFTKPIYCRVSYVNYICSWCVCSFSLYHSFL